MPTLDEVISADWMRVGATGFAKQAGEETKEGIIYGAILAEEGPFKDGRGQFTADSIRRLASLTVPEKGIKSRLAHPNLSDDGVGKYLGRYRDHRLTELDDGRLAVVADLHFDPAASISPHGDLQKYITARADSDPDSFGNSIVGHHQFFDPETGDELTRDDMYERIESAPNTTIWMPMSLHAADVVDEGNATSSLLSDLNLEKLDALPDGGVRIASKVLDQVFASSSREVVQARGLAFLNRYLDNRFGREEMTNPTPAPEEHKVEPPVSPTAEQQAAAELEAKKATALASERAVKIAQLCTTARCPEKAAEFIGNEALSVEAVQGLLFAQMAQQNAMSAEAPQPESGSQSPDDKLEAEFHQNRNLYDQMGVTLDALKDSERVERTRGKLQDSIS